eukprot:5072221-Prymnesium_polylepis.1
MLARSHQHAAMPTLVVSSAESWIRPALRDRTSGANCSASSSAHQKSASPKLVHEVELTCRTARD